jgi:hypothetical protein
MREGIKRREFAGSTGKRARTKDDDEEDWGPMATSPSCPAAITAAFFDRQPADGDEACSRGCGIREMSSSSCQIDHMLGASAPAQQ